jgi:formamidopyrimidine-DNA glycosylase
MNSKNVVGVGNIYANEALFRAKIRPTKHAGRLSLKSYEELSKEIVLILKKSIDKGGTTLRDFVGSDNKPGYFKQQLEVYGRQGEECKICSSILKNVTIGQRSSVFCPKCQK